MYTAIYVCTDMHAMCYFLFKVHADMKPVLECVKELVSRVLYTYVLEAIQDLTADKRHIISCLNRQPSSGYK